jgi:hypothetical protein
MPKTSKEILKQVGEIGKDIKKFCFLVTFEQQTIYFPKTLVMSQI